VPLERKGAKLLELCRRGLDSRGLLGRYERFNLPFDRAVLLRGHDLVVGLTAEEALLADLLAQLPPPE